MVHPMEMTMNPSEASSRERTYFTPQQGADYIGCYRRTIYNAIRSGRLSAMKLWGRNYRLTRESLDAFLTPHHLRSKRG